ncbi:MAG: hypothetical protein ACLUDU_09810 [Butyricimonas faecihominis]
MEDDIFTFIIPRHASWFSKPMTLPIVTSTLSTAFEVSVPVQRPQQVKIDGIQG